MHYKASPTPGFQPPDSRGDLKAYYAVARSGELLSTVRRYLLPGRSQPHTRSIELRCNGTVRREDGSVVKGHSTGCAMTLALITNIVGEPPVESAVVYAKYYAFIKPKPADTFDPKPAVTTGRHYQSVTIRCMICGKEQKRKAVYGLEAAKNALENGSLSCAWMI
ncbi:MAG: hypothetical protein J0I04_02485 [Paenarthrobacter ureafaciens]|uniref:hypothetical protein n=1 Tax=Paenarthrobacter ureafaciens TaxID=37931 RepID=UPI001AC74A43|nr:hypothetical protein [Paenarthrobacter ureafaciens]MBN9128506.1 hypothetical protein [Paenarthrobacter ureafaciens]